MSETQVTVQETPVEQRYSYQPTDGEGRPIGAPQVIKYTTQEELVQKIQEQNILLIRKLRDQTKKVRLGIEETEELDDNLEHFQGPVEFKPRQLSDEESYDIARRLQDPVTAGQATQEFIEAKLGAPLDSIGSTLQKTQQEVISLRAKLEANAFIADNPDYYKCPENFEAITSWMVRYNLDPVRANFQKAYDTLNSQGLLVNGPAAIVREAPVVVEEPIVIAQPAVEQPVVVPGIPSGLSNDNSSSIGTPIPVGSDITYVLGGNTLTGLQAIAAMPSEEYARRLKSDRTFGPKVDKLEAEAKKSRQPRG